MSHLEDIPVFSQPGQYRNELGMVEAVVTELIELMDAYLIRQAAGAIDIKSMPLGETAYQMLKDRLGRGEVRAIAELSGETEVYETDYSGVWWVKHKNMDDRVIAEHLEVCRIPAVLCAHNEDIKVARNKLAQSNPDN